MNQLMKDAYATIIKSVGEDLSRPGLVDTPERAAKAMEFLTQGYQQNVDDIINGALFPTTSKTTGPAKKVSCDVIYLDLVLSLDSGFFNWVIFNISWLITDQTDHQ